MHFNVRSMQKNFDQLSMILTELQKLPDIIALTETKLSPNQIPTNINLKDYEQGVEPNLNPNRKPE